MQHWIDLRYDPDMRCKNIELTIEELSGRQIRSSVEFTINIVTDLLNIFHNLGMLYQSVMTIHPDKKLKTDPQSIFSQ